MPGYKPDFEEILAVRSPKTRAAYRFGLRIFLSVCGFRSEAEAIRFLRRRGADDALMRFVVEVSKRYAPKSVWLFLSAVKTWLAANRIPYDPLRLRRFLPKKRIVKEGRPIMRPQLKLVLNVLHPSKRLAVWAAWALGLRVSEVVGLRVGDLGLSSDPPRAVVRGSKTEASWRTVFIPRDLAEELRRHIQGRRPELPLFSSEKGVEYPMNEHNLALALHGALKRLKLQARDPSGRGWVYSFHSLRRGFETTLHNAGMPMGPLALLLGHNLGTEASYYKPSVNELAAIWKQYERYLLLEGVDALGEDTLQLKWEVESSKQKFEELSEKVEALEEAIQFYEALLTDLSRRKPRILRELDPDL